MEYDEVIKVENQARTRIAVLDGLAVECEQIANEHGFWEEAWNFGEKIALIHSEASEALEAHRTGRPTSEVVEELADAVIRIFDLCGHLKWDLAGAILEKMAVNRARPFKHGKAY